MRLKINKEDDILYLHLDESAVVESEEVEPDVILDFNDKDQVVGVEMLGVSKRVSVERLKVIQV